MLLHWYAFVAFVAVAIGSTAAAAAAASTTAARNKTLSPKSAAAATASTAAATTTDGETKDKRQVNQHTRVPVANHGYGPSAGAAAQAGGGHQALYAEQPLQHKAFASAEQVPQQQQQQHQQQQQLADQEYESPDYYNYQPAAHPQPAHHHHQQQPQLLQPSVQQSRDIPPTAGAYHHPQQQQQQQQITAHFQPHQPQQAPQLQQYHHQPQQQPQLQQYAGAAPHQQETGADTAAHGPPPTKVLTEAEYQELLKKTEARNRELSQKYHFEHTQALKSPAAAAAIGTPSAPAASAGASPLPHTSALPVHAVGGLGAYKKSPSPSAIVAEHQPRKLITQPSGSPAYRQQSPQHHQPAGGQQQQAYGTHPLGDFSLEKELAMLEESNKAVAIGQQQQQHQQQQHHHQHAAYHHPQQQQQQGGLDESESQESPKQHNTKQTAFKPSLQLNAQPTPAGAQRYAFATSPAYHQQLVGQQQAGHYAAESGEFSPQTQRLVGNNVVHHRPQPTPQQYVQATAAGDIITIGHAKVQPLQQQQQHASAEQSAEGPYRVEYLQHAEGGNKYLPEASPSPTAPVALRHHQPQLQQPQQQQPKYQYFIAPAPDAAERGAAAAHPQHPHHHQQLLQPAHQQHSQRVAPVEISQQEYEQLQHQHQLQQQQLQQQQHPSPAPNKGQHRLQHPQHSKSAPQQHRNTASASSSSPVRSNSVKIIDPPQLQYEQRPQQHHQQQHQLIAADEPQQQQQQYYKKSPQSGGGPLRQAAGAGIRPAYQATAAPKKEKPVVRLPPPDQKRPLTQAEFQALVDAGYKVQAIPVPVPVPIEKYVQLQQQQLQHQQQHQQHQQQQPQQQQQQQPQYEYEQQHITHQSSQPAAASGGGGSGQPQHHQQQRPQPSNKHYVRYQAVPTATVVQHESGILASYLRPLMEQYTSLMGGGGGKSGGS